MQTLQRRWAWALCALLWVGGLALAGCGGEGDAAPADTAEADAGDTADAADGGGEDTPPAEDATDAADGADAGGCPQGPACLDEQGAPNLGLCPQPVKDWTCTGGCCVPKFRCADDADCAAHGAAEGQCPDDRFDCRCVVDTGVCKPWYCAVAGDCADGEVCRGGACVAAPPTDGATVRFASQPEVMLVGASVTLVADVRSADGTPLVGATLEVDISPAGALAIEEVADGTVQLEGVGAETASVRARVAGAGDDAWSDPLEVRVIAPPAAEGIVVVVTDLVTGLGVATGGAVLLIDPASGDTVATGELTADGVARFDGPVALPVDLHVLPDAYAVTSVLALEQRAVQVVSQRTFFAALQNDASLALPAGEQTVVGGDVVTGTSDFSRYEKAGEIQVSVQALALRSGIFAFDLPVILGPNVLEFPDPEAPGIIPQGQQSEIPGGLTFGLNGRPVFPRFYLAGPAGRHDMWVLGGRIAGGEVAQEVGQIIGAVNSGGELDFNLIVSAVFPRFGSFFSGIERDLDFGVEPDWPAAEVTSSLEIPLGLATEVAPPPLPELAEGQYMDLLVAIAGALRPDGSFLPLGLSGGSDGVEDREIDGQVDPQRATPEIEPLVVNHAPAHSGLDGPTTTYALAVVGISVNPGGDNPKDEAGATFLTLAPHAEGLGSTTDVPADALLPPHVEAAWDEAAQTLQFTPDDVEDAHRIVFRGARGAEWHILPAPGTGELVVPDLAAHLPDDLATPLATAGDGFFAVIAFELRGDLDRAALLDLGDPGHGFDTLLRDVRRSSFVNRYK